MDHRVTPATEKDLPALLRMVRARFALDEIPFDDARERRSLLALFAQPSHGSAWILWSGEELAGYFVVGFAFSLEHGGRVAVVSDLYVQDIFRRHGLARLALGKAESVAREGGAIMLSFETFAKNAAALALADKAGLARADRVTFGKRVLSLGDLRLVRIERDGSIAGLDAAAIARTPLADVLPMTIALYEKHGFSPPWISYVALDGEHPVGTCAFKSPPHAGEVELAYYTFPAFEGRGVASWMAARLVAIANEHDAAIDVTAQTLPKESASTSILRNLGFQNRGALLHPEDGLVWEWRQRKY